MLPMPSQVGVGRPTRRGPSKDGTLACAEGLLEELLDEYCVVNAGPKYRTSRSADLSKYNIRTVVVGKVLRTRTTYKVLKSVEVPKFLINL